MSHPELSLMSRLSLALSSFFAILSRPEFAAAVARLAAGGPTPTPAPAPATAPVATSAPVPVPPPPPPAPVLQALPDAAALQLLGLLQQQARFIDFIEEDVAAYADAEIGAAARVVHEGCRKVLRGHFSLVPVRSEPEGSRVTLPAGFDAAAVRLTGHVVGQAPFTGSLSHRGWRVSATRMPQLVAGHDPAIVAQAEVEL